MSSPEFSKKPIQTISSKIISDDISEAWVRYLTFAIYVVGISGGVRIWELEKYITPRKETSDAIILTSERWTLEIYRCIIGTLESVAWMLLVFFIFALIAYVIMQGLQLRKSKQS
ncbi:MAG: hypothetical protein JXQ90_05045 [Cyclobacteriaceae bacterium]